MNSTSDLSSKLKEARLEKGLTQNTAAEKLNVSRQAISRWENGKGTPDINTLPLISELYNISIDELLGCELCDPENKPQEIAADNTSRLDKTVSNEFSAEKDTVSDNVSSSADNTFNREYVILILLLIFSSFITFADFIVSVCIFVWTWRNRRHYKLILILAILCILLGLNDSYVFLCMFFLSLSSNIVA